MLHFMDRRKVNATGNHTLAHRFYIYGFRIEKLHEVKNLHELFFNYELQIDFGYFV